MEEDNKLIEEMNASSRFEIFKKTINVKNLIKVFFFLLFLNTIYLDILLIQGANNKQTIVQRFESITNQVPEKVITTPNPEICPQSCVSQIQQALSSAKPSATTSPTPASVSNSAPKATTASQAKEYYIPFGSGTGSSGDWVDVPGLQASVDSSSYTSIKSVIFEASLHVPTGNETASVRLYNATDNHPVWNSDVNFSGNTESVLSVSSNINLDSGSKLYKVQMKTQLQFQAVLDQSRLHIITQ